MACSPNNAQLALVELPPGHLLRKFWSYLRDGDVCEITLNVLVTEDAHLTAMRELLAKIGSKGSNQTLTDLLVELKASAKYNDALREILAVLYTHLKTASE